MKKWLWFLWTPLILIGVVLLSVIVIFIAGSYNTTYGSDEYTKTTVDYSDKEMISITTDYEIVIANESLRVIADKVNNHIKEVLGAKLNVVNPAGNTKNYIKLALDTKLNCDYKYTSDNNNVIIKANNKDHLLRGAYAFLEEFGSVTCYTSELIVYGSTISYPKSYTKTYNDYFEMIDSDWISPKDDEYSWFRGYNTDEYRYEAKTASEEAYYNSLGGRVQYISSFCHTYTGQFLNSSKYFDDPEYHDCFAMDKKGNRISSNLCLSNPKTYEKVLEEVFELLNSDKYNPNAPLQIVSLTQPDDLTACRCEECVKCAKEHGGTFAAPNLIFANKIAKAIADAGYKNVAIDTFAYRYTRSCPTGLSVEPNVIIRLCSIECCASHRIDDEHCLANKAFMKDLKDWSEICDRIYIWDYCTNFSYFMSLFPNIKLLAHNLRVFYEYNVKGVYEEGNYTYSKGDKDPEFAELRAYIISKVMQDPYCDYDQEISNFCSAYYGEAGEDMYNFITKAESYVARRHLNIYKNPKLILPCTKAELDELNELFEDAKEVATGDALNHVLNSEICWRYHKMMNNLYEFKGKNEEFDNAVYGDFDCACNSRIHEVDSNYETSSLFQTLIVDLRPLFDLVVGGFIYGP